MKKRLVIALALAFVLSLSLVAGASAKQVKPLLCRGDVAVPTEGHPDTWFGTIYGDINGTIEFGELPAYYVPPALYTFTEWFIIETDDGVIEGYDMGIWYDSGVFRASGWVTKATGRWEYLVGYLMYEDGVTVTDELGVTTFEDYYIGFMPPLPSWWAKVWR